MGGALVEKLNVCSLKKVLCNRRASPTAPRVLGLERHVNTITNLLAGNVHGMHTEETSKPRMLVLNHTTREAWVNVTLSCNTCPACQKRIALAGERTLIEVVNGHLDGILWAEIPYPKRGDAENVCEAIFTPTHIETEVRGILRNARMIDGRLTWVSER